MNHDLLTCNCPNCQEDYEIAMNEAEDREAEERELKEKESVPKK